MYMTINYTCALACFDNKGLCVLACDGTEIDNFRKVAWAWVQSGQGQARIWDAIKGKHEYYR